MSKSRKKELSSSGDAHLEEETLPPHATDFNPSEFEQPASHNEVAAQHGGEESASAIEQTERPPLASLIAPRPDAERHAAATGKRMASLPDKLSLRAGDARVMYIDKGDNRAGIGIRAVFPDGEKTRPSSEEKEIIRRIVKGEEGERSGFNWNVQAGMWHKDILRTGEQLQDIPPMRAVAIRLDAERRVERLAEALAQYHADAASFEERLRLEREQAAKTRTPG